VLLLLAALAMQAAGPSAAYVEAVERYRRGDTDVAGEEWPARRAEREVAGLERLRSRAEGCRDCEARARFASFPFEAAVMLHTDRDVRSREGLDEREEVDPGVAPELAAAQRIAAMIPDDDRRRRFERPWFQAAVLHLLKRGQWLLAAEYATAGLRRYPDDAHLLLARGAVREAQVTLAVRRRAARTVLELTQLPRGSGGRDLTDIGRALLQAEADFRRALRAEPGLLEAQVRIGRVLHLQGEPAKAVVELRQAVATPGGDARVRYLAWLFLGAAEEAVGRADEGMRAYRQALAVIPDGQAAVVGLSHSLHRLGERGPSRDVLLPSSFAPGRAAVRDPWWDYRWGEAHELEDRLHALRRQAWR
jgi:tetratricopeptide (TPR) repeat protein